MIRAPFPHRSGCPDSRTAWLVTSLALALALGCAHHLRYEHVETREEPQGREIITDAGELVVTVLEQRDALLLRVERVVRIDQDFEVVQEAEEVVVPWSGYALVQTAFMAWNPLFWFFPELWTEPDGRDHSVFHDWLLLWNPLVRAGGEYEAVTRHAVMGRRRERRHLGEDTLPINQTAIELELEGGGVRETLTRTTDNAGGVRIELGILPPAMRVARPLRVTVSVPGHGRRVAELF